MNPFRSFTTWLKARRDPSAFIGTTLNELSGISRGSKSRPFDVKTAIRKFHGWTFVAASLNANVLASTPLRMYMRKKSRGAKLFATRPVTRSRKAYLYGDGRDRPSLAVLGKIAEFGEDWEEVAEPHNAIRLLSTVNPVQNGFEFASLRMVYLQLTGNAYIHPVMNGAGGTPGELWPMPPQNVWIEPSPDNQRMIAGYRYGRTRESGTQFANDEVIHFKLPNPEDPFFYGLGRVKAVWTALGLSEGKREVDTAKYDNYCRPDFVLGADGAGPEGLQRIEQAFEQRLGGRHNAGKMIAVGGKVTGVQLSLADAIIGDPDRVIEEIAAGFGVSISMLLANDPNRAGAEQGDASWMRNTILPYLRMDEEELNASYLPLWGIEGDACLAYDNPVPEDKTAALEATKVALGGAPFRTVNERRHDDGLDPVDGGDVLMVPTTLMPAGSERPDPMAGIVDAISGTQPAQSLDAPGTAQAIQTTEATVLNGAQVTAAASIVAQVTAGELPRDSGVAMLTILFNLTPDKAEAMMGSAGTSKPTSPNPNPAAEAERQAQADAAAAQNAGEATAGPAKGIPVIALGDASPLPGHIARVVKVQREVSPGVWSVMVDYVTADEAKSLSFAAHESELATIVRGIFAEQKAEAMEWAAKSASAIVTKDDDRGDKPKPPPLATPLLALDFTKWDKRLADAAKPVVEKVLRDAAKETIAQYKLPDKTWSVVDRNIPKAAENLSLKFAESTNDTTSLDINGALAQLRQEIADGITEGDTLPSMIDRVSTIFENADKRRAETIARTETSRARHTAEIHTAVASGVVRGKRWLASADACDICEQLATDSADGIPLDQPYATTKSEKYPTIDSPPGHVNCQCSQTLILIDEYQPE